MKCGSELWQFEDGTELSSRFIECPATGSSPDKPAFQPVFMTFPVSGVHPLTGGNGRTARIMMNAELAAEGEERIIVPTVFRGRFGIEGAVTQGPARNRLSACRTGCRDRQQPSTGDRSGQPPENSRHATRSPIPMPPRMKAGGSSCLDTGPREIAARAGTPGRTRSRPSASVALMQMLARVRSSP